MKNIKKIIQQNKELFWDIADLEQMSDQLVEERFLQYGNWDNIIELVKIFGIKKFTQLYLEIRDKNRTSLSPKTINFFNIYLNV